LNSNHKIRISDIYRDNFSSYLNDPKRHLFITNKHLKAVNKSFACRTAKLGIAVYGCHSCGDLKYIYRSCKHRFCSRCGAADTLKWAEKTLMSLLNVKHHHVVFTLPSPLRFLAKKNGNLLHNLLFKCSAQILQEWFEFKHNIKAGFVSVLHTAGSDLKYHPHVHMIVTGGGLDILSNELKILPQDYLTKQRFLALKFKRKLSETLIKLQQKGKIQLPKKLKDPSSFKRWLEQIGKKHWIVSIQKPLDDVHQIVGYVGRYTKRSCLSEYKIKENSHRIAFEFNDYKNTPRGEKPRVGIRYLRPTQFLDKLLQHVPDPGYKAVRYYGIYNAYYNDKLPKEHKVEVDFDDEIEFDDNYEWGEHEQLRKDQIKKGKQDPLHCYQCNNTMKLLYYQYGDKDAKPFDYDSS